MIALKCYKLWATTFWKYITPGLVHVPLFWELFLSYKFDQPKRMHDQAKMNLAIPPISSNSQIWVVTHHQYGISVLVSQMSFGRETSGNIATCQQFSQQQQQQQSLFVITLAQK